MKNDAGGCAVLVVLAVGIWFFATHLWALWILLGIAVLTGGVWFWWNRRPSVIAKREQEKKQAEIRAEQERKAQEERERARKEAEEKAKKKADEERKRKELRERQRVARLMEMPTATIQHLIGYRILRQIRMVRVDDCDTHNKADLRLREQAEKAGASGIINLKIRPYPGGMFSAEGDAVELEPEGQRNR